MSKSLSTGRQSTIVRLELESGIVGYGECWGPSIFSRAYEKFLSDYVVGADVLAIEHVFTRILARHYHFGRQGPLLAAISGIDIAAKDAAGKLLGLSVAQLIGGRRLDEVAVYASGGYLTETPREDFAPQIERMAEAGYPWVKIKIGLGPESDEERVAEARRILGPDVNLLVDINSNYTLDLALETLARIAPYKVSWVEEPLSPDDLDGYGRLRARADTPIAAGEALYTVFDFKRLVDHGGADILQPDLTLCGGFWQARKIAELAQVNHLRLSPHVWGGAIGLAAALQFISSLSVFPHADNVPRPVLLEYDLGENPLRDQLLRTPIVARDGGVEVPVGPGLGIEIDEEALARYGSD